MSFETSKTKDLIPVTSSKHQENTTLGSPQKTCSGNQSHSSDPCNSAQVIATKRKTEAGEGGEKPCKRRRCEGHVISSKHGEMGDLQIKGVKRKASVDDLPPEKKTRISISTSFSGSHVISPEGSKVELEERKTSSTDSNEITRDESDEEVDDCIDIIASAEEEEIYELASSANTNRDDFMGKYFEYDPIGKGGFGSVYSGFRLTDFLPVAIKHVPWDKVRFGRVTCNGKVYNVILEVAFMLKTAGKPGSVGQSAAVSLLDWYVNDQELLLVMERPDTSKDLRSYLKAHRGSLDEHQAKMILKQLVDAAADMHSKGVFHRDIKPQNVLVQGLSRVPRVRVIDFGCGSFSTENPYHSFCGTLAYTPPEWFESGTYHARSTTVWQLGGLFYSLLSGHEPFNTKDFVNGSIKINSALSTDVKTLLRRCLATNPKERATLEELQLHPALSSPSPLFPHAI